MATSSWAAGQVTPEHLIQAAAVCRQTLTSVVDRDWSIPAGSLTWTCRETLDHISDALAFYCGQLAAQRKTGMPRFRNSDPKSSIPNLLLAVETGAAILAAVARGSSPDARGWHRMGVSDAEGFLAMACEEILIHTWDIAQGFGLEMTVPVDLAAAVVGRIFPWAPTSCSAWEAQLWCSDRIALDGLGKIGRWGWHAAPLREWDGASGAATLFGS